MWFCLKSEKVGESLVSVAQTIRYNRPIYELDVCRLVGDVYCTDFRRNYGTRDQAYRAYRYQLNKLRKLEKGDL